MATEDVDPIDVVSSSHITLPRPSPATTWSDGIASGTDTWTDGMPTSVTEWS